MVKKNMVVLVMRDSDGIEWVNVELSEAAAKRLVKCYKESGLALRASFRSVAA